MSASLMSIGSDVMVFPKEPMVFCVPVKGEVNSKMVSYIKKSIDEAVSNKADVIILIMDSYGGYLTSCDEIRKDLLRSPIPVWTFVDNKAISAGAMITISTSKIFMTQDALIGASTVVTDQFPLPDKYQSLARARMRGSATLNCRDPKIAEDMVGYYDKESDDDRVLSLTSQEALAVNYCDGIYESVTHLLESEVPGHVLTLPSDDVLDLLLSVNDTSLSSSDGVGVFSALITRLMDNLWIFWVLYMYGVYCKVKAQNEALKSSTSKLLEIIKNK
jgi:membrane-bound ClpP family serine protease